MATSSGVDPTRLANALADLDPGDIALAVGLALARQKMRRDGVREGFVPSDAVDEGLKDFCYQMLAILEKRAATDPVN